MQHVTERVPYREEYDVNNAHHLSRAGAVSSLADDLHGQLQAHAATWGALESALDTLPGVTEKLWKCNADVDDITKMMSETEEMLLEVEIGIKVDELYARDYETALGRRSAELAHREEVERMEVFRRQMALEAQNAEVTQKSRQEIALEEELKRDLKAIRKAARKQAKSQLAAAGASGTPLLAGAGAVIVEDHFVGGGGGCGLASPRGPGGKAATPGRQTLAQAAAELDVSGSMHASVSKDLDDFLADADEPTAADQRTYYTVYGLRRQADHSRAFINNEDPPKDHEGPGSRSREAAEAVGRARQKALNMTDEDLVGINLKPPPPPGGAGADLLDDALGANRSPAVGAKDFGAAARVGVGGRNFFGSSSSSLNSFGTSLLGLGMAGLEAAQARTKAAAVAAQERTKTIVAGVGSAVATGGERWSQHLQGGAGETRPSAAAGAPVGEVTATVSAPTVTETSSSSALSSAAAPAVDAVGPSVAEAESAAEAEAVVLREPTPVHTREDRDEGFDEITSKEESFGFWKSKDQGSDEAVSGGSGGDVDVSTEGSKGGEEKRGGRNGGRGGGGGGGGGRGKGKGKK